MIDYAALAKAVADELHRRTGGMNRILPVAKAAAAGVGAAAAYLVGVIPAEGGFDDLSTVQWLAVIPIVLGVYGITWRVPNTS